MIRPGRSPGYTDAESLALNTFVKLMRASETVAVSTHRHLAAAGITATQFGVLEALHHLGPLTQRQIGRKILKSGGNITTVVDNLERRALVVRRRDTGDRRCVTVELTLEGGRLIADIFPRHAAVITAEMGILTAAEQAQLGRLCRKLGLKDRSGPPKGEESCGML
jgi:MarR family 2-MHQ and catechol resistance regulon transcriptional repressor